MFHRKERIIISMEIGEMENTSLLSNCGAIPRIDYFLIWGNGLIFEDDILSMIERSSFEILYIIRYKPKKLNKLIRAIYSYDYAPFEHLKAKTRYLYSTHAEVLFIFVRNLHPQEYYSGEGPFRHIECSHVKMLKTKIREYFNPRIDGKFTHNHIVHASDNSLQTHNILKWLGKSQGIYDILPQPFPFINLPSYILKPNSFKLCMVPINNISCRNILGDRWNYKTKEIRLDESVQYRSFVEGPQVYTEYLRTFRGTALKVHYSMDRFSELAKDFSYLAIPNTNDYIILSEKQGNCKQYVILDGLHRAAILKRMNYDSVLAAIVK